MIGTLSELDEGQWIAGALKHDKLWEQNYGRPDVNTIIEEIQFNSAGFCSYLLCAS